MKYSIIILAAGQGTRMLSQTPKILHYLGGKPILQHVIEKAQALSDDVHIIYGHQGEVVQNAFRHFDVRWVYQAQPLGTGHAVMQAIPAIPDEHGVMILMGDCPLVQVETLKAFASSIQATASKLGVLSTSVEQPFGYGRIVRNSQGRLCAIIEERDATVEQRLIKEINTGIYFAPAELLKLWLPQLSNENQQREYLLTDIVKLASSYSQEFFVQLATDSEEFAGINDRIQLAKAERFYQKRQAEYWMKKGVTFLDPSRVEFRGEHINLQPDVTIDINVILEGPIHIGSGSYIGPNCVLKGVNLAEKVYVHSHSVLEQTCAETGCEIGPFARLRPDTYLKAKAKVGNFVEIKKTTLGEHSKANHLSYLGDAQIGKNVNIGAGVITCNYDGVNKHQTEIGDEAFIGSNSQLVAPVKIESNATIGAGSTITHDAPAGLTLSRVRQVSYPKWKRPKKQDG